MATLNQTNPRQKIKLHRSQSKFLQSKALYRGFAGGVGSGKSWAGAYDLIRRAKADRLYMIVAPTYSMLSDATFRSFLTLAETMGIVDPGEVKRSAPPSIRLRTGAEILFRSADDPDKLRGPNLSGIWMDEASLMAADAFTIGIGRLREAGEQGWLTATFTPKGRKHWTYSTFATGKPNTAIFFARTRDNPFLPAGFDNTLREQYTSQLADQELEGKFVEIGGSLFHREWFKIVDAAPADLRNRVRYWDLAGTEARPGADPDWTAGPLIGRTSEGLYYILDMQRVQLTPRGVEQLILQTARLDGYETTVMIEQEPGSAGVAVIRHYAHILDGFPFAFERPTGSKATRAMPFAAQAEAGNVFLVRGQWNADFLDEAQAFPGTHDDQIDAASGGVAKLARSVPLHDSRPLICWPAPELVAAGLLTSDARLIDGQGRPAPSYEELTRPGRMETTGELIRRIVDEMGDD